MQLTALPSLGASHPELKIYEAHKNRVAALPDGYFTATPALERVSLWKNALTSLPASIAACYRLVSIQAQENGALTSLPDGPHVDGLRTLSSNPRC